MTRLAVMRTVMMKVKTVLATLRTKTAVMMKSKTASIILRVMVKVEVILKIQTILAVHLGIPLLT